MMGHNNNKNSSLNRQIVPQNVSITHGIVSREEKNSWTVTYYLNSFFYLISVSYAKFHMYTHTPHKEQSWCGRKIESIVIMIRIKTKNCQWLVARLYFFLMQFQHQHVMKRKSTLHETTKKISILKSYQTNDKKNFRRRLFNILDGSWLDVLIY